MEGVVMIGPEQGPPIWTKHEETRRTGTPMTERELEDLPPVPRSYIVTPGTVVSIIIILVVILIVVILASVGVQF
jgi:hypothetical protein